MRHGLRLSLVRSLASATRRHRFVVRSLASATRRHRFVVRSLASATRRHRSAFCAVIGAVAVGLMAWARPVLAEEPTLAGEPRLLSETGEVTSVVDAFDKDDPFDLHLSLGFRQTWKTANIRRETSIFQRGLSTGNFVSRSENVAAFSQSVSTLNMQADIGVYRDLAFIVRLPLILSDTRELSPLEGSDRNPSRFQDSTGATLFSPNAKSPTRSGVDYIAFGLNYGIFNQRRDATKPNWVVGVETRVGVGAPLRACLENPAPGVAKCPDPADATKSRDPGISRAQTTLVVQTMFSRRIGYVEPYTGLGVLLESPQSRGDFGASSDLKGTLLNRPPIQGSFTMGFEVVPWEQPEQFQRVVADFRMRGTFFSPGRDYSELFDALGTSQAPSLRNPNPGGYRANAEGNSVADASASKVYFAGITDTQGYATFQGSASVTWQAGEYIKFTAGTGLTFVQSHAITSADACNPDFKSDPATSGPCRTAPGADSSQTVTGIPNPNHRPVIDLPGHRFSADDTKIVDLWLNGTVMF
jgi:hypothetical protein